MTTISTANLGFFDEGEIAESVNSDYNIERQPEIAIWPPKPEIVIPLELQQTASKFQRQVRDFWWRARIKCRQVIATTTETHRSCKHGTIILYATLTQFKSVSCNQVVIFVQRRLCPPFPLLSYHAGGWCAWRNVLENNFEMWCRFLRCVPTKLCRSRCRVVEQTPQSGVYC